MSSPVNPKKPWYEDGDRVAAWLATGTVMLIAVVILVAAIFAMVFFGNKLFS